MAKSVQQIVEKWKRNTAAAGPSYVAGIQAVTEAPGQAAARKADKWREGVMRAAEENRFAQGSAQVPLATWQEASIKGSKNLASGVNKGESKVVKFQEQWQPVIQASKAQCRSMPDLTPEDRKGRMNANFDNLSRFKFRKY